MRALNEKPIATASHSLSTLLGHTQTLLIGQRVNTIKMLSVIATEPPPLSVVSSSPGSTISSTNGKRSETDETGSERNSTSSEGGRDNGSLVRKKLRLTKEQAAILEETCKHQCTLNQTKFKKTEVDCAYLKRRCKDLAEENRRLQKDVAELRAHKYFANTQPPTTLTMCTQCGRVGKVPTTSPIA